MCADAHLSSQYGGGWGNKTKQPGMYGPAWPLETVSQNQIKPKGFSQLGHFLLFISIYTLNPLEAPKSLRRAFAHAGCVCGMCLLLTHRCKPWTHPLGCSSDMSGALQIPGSP